MKILCLHGFGSSGKILERQLAGVIEATDPSYDFVFIDGPVSAPRGPGESSKGSKSHFPTFSNALTRMVVP